MMERGLILLNNMGKTIIPVPRASHTAIEDPEIIGLDEFISNNEKIAEANENLHDELHTVGSHTDATGLDGAKVSGLTSGEATDAHKHVIEENDVYDGGEF